MLTFRIRTNHCLTQYRVLILLVVVLLILSTTFHYPRQYAGSLVPKIPGTSKSKTKVAGEEEWRVAKVSMLYGGPNEVYEQALATHGRQSALCGYPMHVLRRSITTGFWNKFLWLQTVMVNELSKPEEERMDWIWFTDASVIILNTVLPLSTFLPPRNETAFSTIHLLATKPSTEAHLSTSSFFIRISPFSLTLLTRAMAAPIYTEGEWGASIDASSLQAVLEKYSDPYSDAVLFQPQDWYNPPVLPNNEMSNFHEGDIAARFPGELGGDKWKMMVDAMVEVQAHPQRYNVELQKTRYPGEVKKFWERVKKALNVLREAKSKVARGGKAREALMEGIRVLEECIRRKTWDDKGLDEAVWRVEEVMKEL